MVNNITLVDLFTHEKSLLYYEEEDILENLINF